MKTMTASSTRPVIRVGWRYQRARRARTGVTAGGGAGAGAGSAETALMRPPRWRSSAAFAGPQCLLVHSQARSRVEPHSRVKRDVGHVGEQVDQNHQHAVDEGDRLDDGEVALEDRVDHQAAEAGDGEDLLHDEGAADEVADVDAEHG